MLKNVQFSKPIGIVGGAGPMASIFLCQTIIEICQKEYGCNDYSDFPEIILESYPFIRGDREKIRHDIALCFSKLQKAGAKLFSIASNSFHGFLPDTTSVAFVNLVLESVGEASRLQVSKALILAAQPTIDLKLYELTGLQCIYPSKEDQQLIQKIIREVAGGMITKDQAQQLKGIINTLQEKSQIDGIIIACTELPLIHRQFPIAETGLPVVDTVEVLARRLLVLAQE